MSPQEKDEGAMPPPESAPRRRVLDLVLRMARVTALGGAALGLSACESGPIVCDPLPPPITCANPTRAELQQAMVLQAQWVAGQGGALQVALAVDFVGQPSVTFSSTVSVTGGTAGDVVVSPRSLAVNLAPGAGATAVSVVVTFDCSGTTDAMTLRLDVQSPPHAGSPVPVSITAP